MKTRKRPIIHLEYLLGKYMPASTVPIKSICQSQVTGPLNLTKCQRCHAKNHQIVLKKRSKIENFITNCHQNFPI